MLRSHTRRYAATAATAMHKASVAPLDVAAGGVLAFDGYRAPSLVHYGANATAAVGAAALKAAGANEGIILVTDKGTTTIMKIARRWWPFALYTHLCAHTCAHTHRCVCVLWWWLVVLMVAACVSRRCVCGVCLRDFPQALRNVAY